MTSTAFASANATTSVDKSFMKHVLPTDGGFPPRPIFWRTFFPSQKSLPCLTAHSLAPASSWCSYCTELCRTCLQKCYRVLGITSMLTDVACVERHKSLWNLLTQVPFTEFKTRTSMPRRIVSYNCIVKRDCDGNDEVVVERRVIAIFLADNWSSVGKRFIYVFTRQYCWLFVLICSV